MAPSAAITMSTLSVCRNGMRLAAIVGTSSSWTPMSLARSLATSMSNPSGSRLAFKNPQGARSWTTAILTFPFRRISSSVAALAVANPEMNDAMIASTNDSLVSMDYLLPSRIYGFDSARRATDQWRI
ncbi:hypothetical protein CHELA1G11_20639 [Hyphomicrobiales bacterium]|nr:hypothetical protein CHELA1G11_20639 [Hyphomicrobiales bacterium]CAH1691188.1 hypothetical protein CHELA1G2_20953 [Hyphomicrobiales bacterium]